MTVPPTFALEAAGPYAPDVPQAEAEGIWAGVRDAHGFVPNGRIPILTPPENQKKVNKNTRPTWALTLQSGDVTGMCVNTVNCHKTCVGGSGKQSLAAPQSARDARTYLLLHHPQAFLTLWHRDIAWMARNRNAVDGRPNTNSDVAWEKVFPSIFEDIALRGGRAYDYTKRIDRAGWMIPDLYRVSFSAQRHTRYSAVARLLGRGVSVTMIFPTTKFLPSWWGEFPVLDGDVTDDRWSDPVGHVVGLRWKNSLRGKHGHPLVSHLHPRELELAA